MSSTLNYNHTADEDQPLLEACIKTINGVYLDLLAPVPSGILGHDIAHALSLVNRFGGHTPEPYSVGEHCIIVAQRLLRTTGDAQLALAGLVHDAAEAYIQDINGLLKKTPELEGYREVEERLTRTIEKAFELPRDICDTRLVKEADKWAFDAECSFVRDNVLRVAPKPADVRAEWLGLATVLGAPLMVCV